MVIFFCIYKNYVQIIKTIKTSNLIKLRPLSVMNILSLNISSIITNTITAGGQIFFID